MEATPVTPMPQRSVVLVVRHLGRIDPQSEHHAAAELHAEVALARHLEAKARLRGRVLTPQSQARTALDL